VLYDANVLYPSMLRDLLIRVAQAGLVQAKWTDQILDEVFGNLATNRPDLDPQRLARTRELMNRAVRDCLVTGYEPLVAAVDLPDPGSRRSRPEPPTLPRPAPCDSLQGSRESDSCITLV
jgi:hypothetical protein